MCAMDGAMGHGGLVEPCPILWRPRSLKIFEAPQIAPTDVMFARSGHVARNRSAALFNVR